MYIARISLFTDNAFIGPICLFGLFGWLAVCCGYLLSFLFQKAETANKWLYSVMALLTLIPYLIVEIAFQGQVPQWINYVLCIFPPYCLYYSIFRLSFAVFLKGGLGFVDTFAFNDAGLGGIFLIMLVECIVLVGAIIFLDFGFDSLKNIIMSRVSSYRFTFDETLVESDEDVKEESSRVDQMEITDASIIIKHVWKAFKGSDETTCMLSFKKQYLVININIIFKRC